MCKETINQNKAVTCDYVSPELTVIPLMTGGSICETSLGATNEDFEEHQFEF